MEGGRQKIERTATFQQSQSIINNQPKKLNVNKNKAKQIKPNHFTAKLQTAYSQMIESNEFIYTLKGNKKRIDDDEMIYQESRQ